MRLKVWNPRHWIVFSDNRLLVGRWFASSPLQRGALAGKDRIGDHRSVKLRSAVAHDQIRLLLTLGIGLVVLYLALFRLVSGASRRLRRQADQNHDQALHDALTGLPNRLLFQDRIDMAVRASRRSATRTAVMLLDLDRFKVINDTLGHGHGDSVLGQIGLRLRTRLRDIDTVARLGGDEFALVLGDLDASVDVVALGRELERLLEEPFDVDGLVSPQCRPGPARWPAGTGLCRNDRRPQSRRR